MKIEKLTQQQELQIKIVTDKWLNKIFSYELNQKNSFEKILKSMKSLYQFCNLKDPIVVYLDSPLACQIAANMLCHSGSQVGSQVESQVESQVWSQVESQVGMTYYTFSSYVNYTDLGILSFFDFMDSVLNLNMNEDWKSWKEWTEASFMSIQLN